MCRVWCLRVKRGAGACGPHGFSSEAFEREGNAARRRGRAPLFAGGWPPPAPVPPPRALLVSSSALGAPRAPSASAMRGLRAATAFVALAAALLLAPVAAQPAGAPDAAASLTPSGECVVRLDPGACAVVALAGRPRTLAMVGAGACAASSIE